MTKVEHDASEGSRSPGTGSSRSWGRAVIWLLCMFTFLLIEVHLVLQQEGGIRLLGFVIFVVLAGLVIWQAVRMTRPPTL